MKSQHRCGFWVIYTCVYCITSSIAFFPFMKEEKTFIWNSDALGQYLPNMIYVYRNIINEIKNLFFNSSVIAFSSFDFSRGVGQDASNLYFRGILEYICILFGISNIEVTFGAIILIRLYCAGLSFASLGFYFKQKMGSIIPGALVYSFTGFTIYYGMRHMAFLIPVILLPLLIMGIEKILRGESSKLFVVCVFYSAWTDYYFLYMNTIILGIYVCIRWIDFKNWRRIIKDFGKIVFYYCIGIGLGGVSLFTKMYKMFSSSRIETYVIESESFFTYEKNWIPQFFARLISPYTTNNYQKFYMLYMVSAIVVPSIVVLFFSKEKEYKKLKILLVIGTIFFFVPAVAFVFSGFSSMVNRWSYGYTLLLAIIVTVMLPKLRNINAKQCLVCAIIVFFMCLNVSLNDAVSETSTYLGEVLLVFCCFGVISLSHLPKKIWADNCFYCIVTFIVIINICINVRYMMSLEGGGFISQFVAANQSMNSYENSGYAVADGIDDESFFRVETNQYSQSIANAPTLFGVKGTSIYDSTLTGNSLAYNDALLNRGQVTINNFYGYDGRSALEALGSVGYYVATDNNTDIIPYGFELYKEEVCENGSTKYIYKNKYKLPIGYVYNAYLTESEVEDMGALELQETMLQAAVINDESDLVQTSSISVASHLSSSICEIPFQLQVEEGVFYEESSFTVEKGGASVSFTYENLPNSEIYLMFDGLNIDQVSDDSMSLRVQAGGIDKTVWVFCSDDKYKLEHFQDYCINLGYQENADKRMCKITFPTAGRYYIDSIKIYAMSMEQYPRYIKNLRKNKLENVVIKKDYVYGTVQSDKEQILCMSIPYDKFWAVYIDDKKIKAECINYMWLGIPISAGNHSIQLVYTNMALRLGLIVSILTVVFLLIYFACQRWQRGRQKNE